jgi:hypothetical protein
MVWRLGPELLSKPKRAGCMNWMMPGYVSSGVAPLDAGVLEEIVDVAERILRDCRHGFERADDEGS